MKLRKINALMLMSIVLCGNIAIVAQGPKKNQKNKDLIVEDTIAGKTSSWSLPNWTDTVGGITLAGMAYAAQMKYMGDFFALLKKDSFGSYRFLWNNVQFVPAIIVGLWSFFELRQVTSAGLYNRAVVIVDRINEFKSLDMSFESVEHFMQYLAYHGNAKELRIINDEYQHVMTHVFLSSILQELTYALRLLERSKHWLSDAVMLAKIDTIMFEIRAKMRHVKHNKRLIANYPHYNVEYARYQQEKQLSQQERLTMVAEDQNALSKVKFVFNAVGRVISFLFGGSTSSSKKA
jgi:hypothetical protein